MTSMGRPRDYQSFNCCLRSVIYDFHGASTGLSVMGSQTLDFFGNLAFIYTESKSLIFTLCCVFLIFFCLLTISLPL